MPTEDFEVQRVADILNGGAKCPECGQKGKLDSLKLWWCPNHQCLTIHFDRAAFDEATEL